jgi:alginate lyase
MDAYRDGVRQITPEGTLPLEMNRAARALHYHLYALAPLVMLAEFGEANSINLYAERNFAIKRLVARCISGLQDHSYFVQHTGKEQDMPELRHRLGRTLLPPLPRPPTFLPPNPSQGNRLHHVGRRPSGVRSCFLERSYSLTTFS